jgi:transposase
MQVRSELMSAQEAARQLGIFRKTYYKWERRALAAMVEALGHRERGRPRLPADPKKEALQRQTQEPQAKLQVLEQTVRIRQLLEQPDKKKKEVAEMAVTTLARLEQEVRWPYQRLTEFLGLPYSSFRRWNHRRQRGQPALFKPGPRKAAPLNLQELNVHLCRLKHGHQRSPGIGRLYRQYKDQISRRELQVLTEARRREFARQRQAEFRHIT